MDTIEEQAQSQTQRELLNATLRHLQTDSSLLADALTIVGLLFGKVNSPQEIEPEQFQLAVTQLMRLKYVQNEMRTLIDLLLNLTASTSTQSGGTQSISSDSNERNIEESKSAKPLQLGDKA